MLAAVIVAVTPLVPKAYAATPQDAVRQRFAVRGAAIHFVRTNIAGRYAVVWATGGIIEGSRLAAPLLIEHFTFGWQPLESLNFSCRILHHHISQRDRTLLLADMPKMSSEDACGTDEESDSGPATDINAIRMNEVEPLLPWVAVAGNYASFEWYGAGGGQVLLHRVGVGRTWVLLQGGGGPLDVEQVREHGVPRKLWCALRIWGVACPGTRTSS